MKTGNIDVLGQHFQMVNVTTTQRDLITKSAGLEVYNTTTAQIEFCDGTTWKAGAGTPGAKGDNGNTGDTGATGPQGVQGIPGTNAPNIAYNQTFTRSHFALNTQQVTITHNLGVSAVVVKVYDTDLVEILPTFIKVMDVNTVRLDFTDWDNIEFSSNDTFSVVVLAAGGTGGSGGTANDSIATFPIATGTTYLYPYLQNGYGHLSAVSVPYTTTVDQLEVLILQQFQGNMYLVIYENTSTTGSNFVLRATTTAIPMSSVPVGLMRKPLTSSYTLLKNRLYHFGIVSDSTLNGGTVLAISTLQTNYPWLAWSTGNISSPPAIMGGSAIGTKIWVQASNSAGN
jgi:hypothetical protein